MSIVFESSRIAMREFGLEDLGELAAMVADVQQMRFYPRTRTRAEAREWIERNLTLYTERDYGIWLVEARSTSEFLGYCGIRPLLLDGAEEVEMGWHVVKSSWGRGIATEAAAAALDLALGRLGLSGVVATIHPEHVASRRVAEKIGMHVERATVLDEDYPALVYRSGR